MRTALTFTAIVLTASLFTFAEDKPAAPATPDPLQMMSKMMEMGTPGPQHQKLKAMEGTFDAEVTMQMAPHAPPMTSKGKMVNQLIFGGRYLHGDFKGDFMGMPFSGSQLVGYDNMKKAYFNAWIDSMSTALVVSNGSANSDGKTITCTAKIDCPADGSVKTMKSVITIIDNNTHTYEAYEVGADGKENKTMTIKYTRADQSAGK
jgi:hypothetical protein